MCVYARISSMHLHHHESVFISTQPVKIIQRSFVLAHGLLFQIQLNSPAIMLRSDSIILLLFVHLAHSSVVNSAGGGAHGENTFTSGGGGGASQYYSLDTVYRNLDTQLLRIGSRLDQLMMRMDHLDSRVGRVQSTGHIRFDSIETSMQTTRQRLDLWSSQLNLVEENLSRKWKHMESRFDSLVSTLDSKLDTKFNLVQRDNRRHNEFISSSFNSVIISQEKLSDRVGNSLAEINSTLLSTQNVVNSTSSATKSHSSTCLSRVDTILHNLTSTLTPSHSNRRGNSIQPDLHVSRPSYSTYGTHQSPPQNSTSQLISTKVSNMFDELVKRSHDLEAIVKDTFTMSNMTRREVQDGFMALIPIVSQVGFGIEKSSSGGGSGEIMSMVVEALSTVEQTSTSLGRRMTELINAIHERFELVSMSLNGFLESCTRIQDRTPQLEENITDVLLRILDSVDTSTRNATETWQRVSTSLSVQPNCTANATSRLADENVDPLQPPPPPPDTTDLDHEFQQFLHEYEAFSPDLRQPLDHEDIDHEEEEEHVPGEDMISAAASSQRRLSDEQKSLWESLRNRTAVTVPE